MRDLYAKKISDSLFWIAVWLSLEMSCQKLNRQGGLDVIVVDYVQQLTLEGRHLTKVNLVTEVSHRSRREDDA